MSKLTSKIAAPIILVGVFAMTVFIALNYEKLDFSFYIVFFIFSLYILSFGLAIGQSLASPLKKLLDKATELSRGNFSSRVYLQTQDEFAELAKVFNKIAEELEASHEQEASAEKSVDIKVKAKTQELQEIISALEQKVGNRAAELEKLVKQLEALGAEAQNKGAEITELKKQIEVLKPKIKTKKYARAS